MSFQRLVYPFTAIVGQSELKLALLFNAVNPRIGGLLIRGQKGTGKSTSVRALAEILPDITVVKGCPFNCSPSDPTNMCPDCLEKYMAGDPLQIEKRRMKIVSLPIGATEDRVVGSLDIEKAISQGIRALQPGLLAEVNQNILYIDEVNLLPDHITDMILDAAASGWNVVEREGISVSHPSRFILIGTMNPEEGELRPQLADRFALHISVGGIYDEELRVEIVKRNLSFGEDPLGFSKLWRREQEELRSSILRARELLNLVEIPDWIVRAVASSCIELHVDGLRPDIAAIRAAKTLAALEGREVVTVEDILKVANMAVGFRTRGGGFEEPATGEQIRLAFTEALGRAEPEIER
ncbi:MAG: ATP-binding protein [Candidatus Bathyarchaeia archaeon]